MNPFAYIRRRPLTTLLCIMALVGGGIFGLKRMRAESYPAGQTPKVYVYLDYLDARYQLARSYIASKISPTTKHGEPHEEHHKVIVTSPLVENVVVTQQYVCQIRSQRHINVCALEGGYLEEVLVREGQAVKKGDLLFKINPTLYQARLDAELAEAQLAQLKFNYTKKLTEGKLPVVSVNEVALQQAELSKAQAKAKLAGAELNFTQVKAPFDGIVDRLLEREGSLIKEEGVLTTLSDNSVMWVYFNVPEARYLEYMASSVQERDNQQIELILANANKFEQNGKIGAIEANFNNETGNIAFRADFPNPDGLLRHGQTGSILIHRVAKDSMVIPQRCTFENLAKRYIYVIGKDDVVHQREITILYELDDIFVIKKGIVAEDEKVVLEGVRQLRDGDKAEFEYRSPSEVMKNQKNPAE